MIARTCGATKMLPPVLILLALFLLFAPCGPWSSQLSQDCIVYKAGKPDVGNAIPTKRTLSALERVHGFRRKI